MHWQDVKHRCETGHTNTSASSQHRPAPDPDSTVLRFFTRPCCVYCLYEEYFYSCMCCITHQDQVYSYTLRCIYIYAFSRRFYPKRLTITFKLYIFISTCVPWESNPQPFAQLTQCSTTEPHRNTCLTRCQI